MYYLNADMMLFGTFHLSTQLIQIVFIISALTSVANGHFYFFSLSLSWLHLDLVFVYPNLYYWQLPMWSTKMKKNFWGTIKILRLNWIKIILLNTWWLFCKSMPLNNAKVKCRSKHWPLTNIFLTFLKISKQIAWDNSN